MGKVVSILLWIATAINLYDSLSQSAIKYPLCIFPNMGLTFALQTINQFERSSKVLGIAQLYTNIFNDTENLGAILAAMFGYTLLYIPAAWYIEHILPGDYGVALPFYFPFMVRTWNKKNNKIYLILKNIKKPSYWKHMARICPVESKIQMKHKNLNSVETTENMKKCFN